MRIQLHTTIHSTTTAATSAAATAIQAAVRELKVSELLLQLAHRVCAELRQTVLLPRAHVHSDVAPGGSTDRSVILTAECRSATRKLAQGPR